MIEIAQPLLFDYASLDSDTRAFVQDKARAIHARLKRTAEDIIAIGQDLIEVKAELGLGNFESWLRTEFDMSQRSAERFMQVSERFKDSPVANLASTPSVLYELVNSDEIIIEMVEAGAIPPTLTAIREAKRREEDEVQDVPTALPSTWGLVNGKPFTAPLPDGKPVEIPDSWKLPVSVRDVHPILNTLTSKSNEWFTPSKYVEAARLLMGTIDLDPASCEEANETVKATRYYTQEENGLLQEWPGTVWLNPPYGRDEAGSNQDVWSRRLIDHYRAGVTTEAVLLVNASVDTKWFQRLFEFPVCFPDHRINFYSPDSSLSGSTHGSALVYFGPQVDRFFEIFSEFGTVVKRW